jgi:hypothetical protein
MGYKMPSSSRKFKRLGWCMVEYYVDGYDHVLCKVYRSPRAKKAPSTSNSAVLPPSPPSKRKAAGDHPEAPPARLGAHQVQETTWLSCDAPMMSVQVQRGAHQVHGDDTCPLVIGNLPMPTHDALEVVFPVQHSAGPQGLNGYYAVAEGPQPGAGPVLGDIDDSGLFSDRFSFFDGKEPAAIDFEELVNQQLHDPFASQEAQATWVPPPLDDSFLDDLPQYTNFFDSEE